MNTFITQIPNEDAPGTYRVCVIKKATAGECSIYPYGYEIGGYTVVATLKERTTDKMAYQYYGRELNLHYAKWVEENDDIAYVDLEPVESNIVAFRNTETAQNAGWYYVAPGKTVYKYCGIEIKCVNTSVLEVIGAIEKYAIVVRGIVLAESKEISIDGYPNGQPSIRFSARQIRNAIGAAIDWIDSQLITQKEAADIYADITGYLTFIQTISNAIRPAKLAAISVEGEARPMVFKPDVVKMAEAIRDKRATW